MDTTIPVHRSHSAPIMGYVPAEAHYGKLTYVELQAFDPVVGRLRAKRYKLNRIKGMAQRKLYARDLAFKLNMMLREGWNPWVKGRSPLTDSEGALSYPNSHEPRVSEHLPADAVSMEKVLELWTAEKKRTRFSSPHNYMIQARLLRDWCERHRLMDAPLSSFTKQHAIAYMEELGRERNIGNNTHNSYLVILRGLFSWAMKREMITLNPFMAVDRKRKTQKIRTILTQEERTAAIEWFAANDPAMVVVCLLVFHTLIRPRNELARLRVKNIDLEGALIRFDGNQTKTGSERHPAIPPSMLKVLKRSRIPGANPDHFVVGRNFKPGPEPFNLNAPALRWDKMRTALGWSKTKQLMSLRDSGIVQWLAATSSRALNRSI